MQNTIVKEFADNPDVVTFIYDQGGQRGETKEWCEKMWSNYFLRGSVVFEASGQIAAAHYKQPNTGLPFGRGFIIDRDGKISLPYFGHDPQMVINKIYELLGKTGVGEKIKSEGMQFRLCQNAPNPFNPQTTIEYTIPKASRVKLTVMNALGQQVAVLVDEAKPAGTYRAIFSSKESSSGIYFYRLQANQFIETRKMLLLR